MAKVEVFIPDELLPMAQDLTRFFSAMVFKLRKNAHKGKWEDLNLSQTMAKLEQEVSELDLAISEGSFCEILLEGADVANFAMIATSVALSEVGQPVAHKPRTAAPASPDGVPSGPRAVAATPVAVTARGGPGAPPGPTIGDSVARAIEQMFVPTPKYGAPPQGQV